MSVPSLSITEAIKLASVRILDFKGRSRRSEFWWWMLVIMLVGFCISLFISNMLVSTIWSIGYMFCGLAVTARRLHDSGKSAVWVYISYAIGCFTNLYVTTSGVMDVVEKLQSVSSNQNAVMRLLEKHMGDFAMLSMLGTLFLVFFLIVFIMCLLDSKPDVNKYGPSPKYTE